MRLNQLYPGGIFTTSWLLDPYATVRQGLTEQGEVIEAAGIGTKFNFTTGKLMYA